MLGFIAGVCFSFNLVKCGERDEEQSKCLVLGSGDPKVPDVGDEKMPFLSTCKLSLQALVEVSAAQACAG